MIVREDLVPNGINQQVEPGCKVWRLFWSLLAVLEVLRRLKLIMKLVFFKCSRSDICEGFSKAFELCITQLTKKKMNTNNKEADEHN